LIVIVKGGVKAFLMEARANTFQQMTGQGAEKLNWKRLSKIGLGFGAKWIWGLRAGSVNLPHSHQKGCQP